MVISIHAPLRERHIYPTHNNCKQQKCNIIRPDSQALSANTDDYQSMTKEELIRELLKARIAEARLKKGYAVEGDGTVILYGNKNTK